MGRVSIEEALDDCLTQLPQDGLEACLRRYPEFADELRPLLQTAAQLHRLGVPTELNVRVRERMRERIFVPLTTLTNVATRPNPRPLAPAPLPAARPRFVVPANLWARMAAAVFVLALLFWGVGAASAAANPGDTLYPVKRFYEGVRYTLSLGGPARANAQLEFAGIRLNEIEVATQRKQRISGSLISDLEDNIGYCINQLNGNDLSDKRTFAAQVGALVQRERLVLDRIGDALEPDAKTVYKSAQQNVVAHYSAARQYAPDLPDNLPTPPANAVPNIGTPLPFTPTLPVLFDTATPSPLISSTTVPLTPAATPTAPPLTPRLGPTLPSLAPTTQPTIATTPVGERTRSPNLTPRRPEPTETARARPPSPPPPTPKPKPPTATPTHLNPMSNERRGYPTQKPEELLARFILASSDVGDLVLDPGCGSGTTLAVAERLGRRWLGIDQAVAAIERTRARLADVEYTFIADLQS